MTDVDVAILEFERQWWRHAGSKEDEVRERWGLLPLEYRQRLEAIAELPDALAFDPMTVRRIRRRLASRLGASDADPGALGTNAADNATGG
jgi:hypothetical protein